MRLLAMDTRLARLRLRIVPARIKETAFWTQYFEQLVFLVTRHVKGEDAPDQVAAPAAK